MKKVLIIDDNHELTEILLSVFNYNDFTAIAFNDSKKGILAAKEFKPDIILLDIMMPEIDGPKTVSLLKSEPITQDISILFLTGLVSNKDNPSMMGEIRVGNHTYKSIAKPFDNIMLINSVNSILSNERQP